MRRRLSRETNAVELSGEAKTREVDLKLLEIGIAFILLGALCASVRSFHPYLAVIAILLVSIGGMSSVLWYQRLRLKESVVD